MFNEVSTFIGNNQSPEIQSEEKTIHYCEFGCGKEAHFKTRTGKWYCSKNLNNCTTIINKRRETLKLTHKKKGHKPRTLENFILYNTKKEKFICPICNKEFNMYISTKNKHIFFCKNGFKRAPKHNKIKPPSIIYNKLNKDGTCKICGQINHPNKEICNYNLSISYLAKHFNIDKSKIGTPLIYEEIIKLKNILIDDYYNKQLSLSKMSKKYNKGTCVISSTMYMLNIKLRSFSESVKLSCLDNTNIKQDNIKHKYKNGWHTTWNNKRIFYRSSYELDYAKELDAKKIDYEVEKIRIKYFDSIRIIECVAIADFYLPETNTIVEIKSIATIDIQNMKDKVKRYRELGYNFKLILEHQEVDINTL